MLVDAGKHRRIIRGAAGEEESEKRYWLHVAIDRFTGEVIDQELEAVYE